MLCPVCHANNRESASFCRRCGAELVLACPSCSAPHPAGQAYCDSCGAVLPGPGPTAAAIEAASGFADLVPSTGPGASELRVASVLFVDLVGYTALSESRDAEDVRDLLGNLLRAGEDDHRSLRRCGREVHRRRRDGGLGRPCGP